MSQLGRISGPLLKSNLIRNGVDLAFETDLLYLDVNNKRIGINVVDPLDITDALTVNGVTRTSTIDITGGSVDIGSINISGDTIASSSGVLNLIGAAGGSTIYQSKLLVDGFKIENNVISTIDSNANIELRPHGTGTVDIYGNTNVTGNITATGNISAGGNIQIGSTNQTVPNNDTVTFNAEISSDIIPDLNDTHALGSVDKHWKDLWVKNLYADTLSSGSLVIDGINVALPQGKIWYVAANGSDVTSATRGTHQNDPFASISKAIEYAVAGDTIYIYPGVYEEIFPLEVPPGVTIHGVSIRSVTIKPTAATRYKDAFHMNGEATVEDVTITGFHHDPLGVDDEFAINNQGTGHAFRFSWGTLTSKRSPYIRNVTVITSGTASVLAIAGQETQTIDGLTRIKNIVDNLVVNDTITKTASNTQNQVINPLVVSDASTGTLLQGLIDDVIHIINNGTLQDDLPTITANGAPVTSGVLYNAAVILENNRDFLTEEITAYVTTTYPSPGFVYDIATCQRDMGYILDAMIYDIKRGGNEHTVYAGLAHWVQPTDDPRGYARADAGHGALIDGGAVDAASKEAAMLFHSVTFLTPAADTLIATNGARVEWLNSFTYFAGKGMYLYSSPEGYAQQGKTRIKIATKTGSWSVGNTLSYYDTDSTTVLASGVIESIEGDFYNIAGYEAGFETISDRASKTISVHGDAKLVTAIKKFGTASLALDGVGDYLTVPAQADFEFGTGAWTEEAWVYNTSQPAANQVIIDLRTSNPQVVPTLYIDGTTKHLRMSVDGLAVIDSGAAFPMNDWTHVAIAKSGTSTKMYINGSQVGSTYTDNNTYIQGAVTIGARFDGTTPFFGNIDDIRISKGVGRYTGSSFTLPTAQLTGDLSTVLLLTLNGVNNSTAIADNGVTLQDIRCLSGASVVGTANYIDFADYSDFGAEVRSIGSACVYGEYGIYGDGDGVIAYLIGQNLAYIGVEGHTNNDVTEVIQANEIVELNRAKIYYQSVDHKGDFRIGDLFYVNQQTGEVTFSNSNINIGTSITFDDGGGNVTFIDATKIETGDFRISGNTVETLTADFNIQAANNIVNLESNVNITGNLDVTGDITIGGSLTIGDQTTDTVSFVAGVNSNILPSTSATYDIGSATNQWKDIYTYVADIGGINISDNVITTTQSNANLELRAHGTGVILVPSNNVQFDQTLTVNGTTYTKDIEVTGSITQTGDVTQTGSLTQTGDITVTGTISVSGDAQFNDVLVSGNNISTTIGNNDLNLTAHGTGKVIVPTADVIITNDLTVNGLATINSFSTNNTLTAGSFNTGDILIYQNNITTTQTNSNLVLEANNNGQVTVPVNDVYLSQQLTVVGTTNTGDINITGTVTQTGDITQVGSTTQTGDFDLTGNLTVSNTAQFKDVNIDNNVITTTIGNNDLSLQAAGTGKVLVPSNNVEVTNDLTVDGITSTTTLNNTGTVTSDIFTTGDISITDNTISTTVSNSNLELLAAGSGKIYVPSNDVQFGQALNVVGTTTLDDTTITGILTHVGNTTQTGDTNQTGDFNLTGNLTVSNTAQFKDVNIDNNVVTTTIGNNDLTLQASGTGNVLVPSNDVQVNQAMTVVGTTSTSALNNTGTITSTTFSTGDISISGHLITTTVTNSNLELQASGTGRIYVPNNNVVFDRTLNVLGVTTLADTTIVGTVTQTGATTQTGSVTQTGSYTLNGNLAVGATAQFKDISIDNNVITTTLANNDLNLQAAGTGRIYVPSNNVLIEQNLTVSGTTTTTTINNSGTATAATFTDGNITINGNVIQTTVTNSNLQLQAAGTGFIELEQFEVQDNAIRISASNTDMVLQPNGTGIVSIDSTQALKLPVGNNTQRPTAASGMIRFNSELTRYEGYNGTTWVRLDGVEDADGNTKITAELTPGANDNTIRFYTDGTQVADLTSTRFNVNNIDVDDININGNTISTTTANTDLIISPNGTGSLRTGNFSFKDNVITNTVNNSITVFNSTGNGYVKINSTGGFVIPSGLTEQRPPLFAVGMMRYNTDPGNFRVEVWDGSNWVNAGQGAGGGVSAAEAQDIGILSAIIFG